jgi:hypothetical protein
MSAESICIEKVNIFHWCNFISFQFFNSPWVLTFDMQIKLPHDILVYFRVSMIMASDETPLPQIRYTHLFIQLSFHG